MNTFAKSLKCERADGAGTWDSKKVRPPFALLPRQHSSCRLENRASTCAQSICWMHKRCFAPLLDSFCACLVQVSTASCFRLVGVALAVKQCFLSEEIH